MAKASDNPFPSLLLVEQASAPATPAAGQARLYRGTDNKLYMVDDAGTATEVGASSGGSGGILAQTAYNPGTLAAYTTTSTTPADVDATNLAVTFTAPASGKVSIRLEAVGGSGGTTGDNVSWLLRSGTTTVAGPAMVDSGGTDAAANDSRSRTFRITGLTPGTSYTYKWGWQVNTVTNTARLYAGGVVGAAIMEVHALP